MAQVTVTIAGRTFRMACGDGEEPHLEGLAQKVDAKIDELRVAFGEIGDQRLTVMAAITFADEASEIERRLARMEAEIAGLKAQAENAEQNSAGWAGAVAEAIEGASQRIERLAHEMNAPSSAT